MIAKIEKIIKWFFWVPFVLAFIGYFWADGGAGCVNLSVVEALYASAALYFVNPVADNANTWILTAEVLAIIVTTSVIISVVSALFGNLGTLVGKKMERFYYRLFGYVVGRAVGCHIEAWVFKK